MAGELREFVVRTQRVLRLKNAELAELCGCSPSTVDDWRKGRFEPSGRHLLPMVNALLERKLG